MSLCSKFRKSLTHSKILDNRLDLVIKLLGL